MSRKIFRALAFVLLLVAIAWVGFVTLLIVDLNFMIPPRYIGILVILSIAWRLFDWLGKGTWMPGWAKEHHSKISK